MMTKREFKILEAVHLGLDYYYMGHDEKAMVTESEIEWARSVLPSLPQQWWLDAHDWAACIS